MSAAQTLVSTIAVKVAIPVTIATDARILGVTIAMPSFV
jgi:hypothetical protein